MAPAVTAKDCMIELNQKDARRIGRGSFSDVYRSRDNRVFKVYKQSLITGGITSDAVQELSALRSLSHPNVLKLLNVHQVKDGGLVAELESLQGSLDQFCSTDYLLENEKRLLVMFDVASGLEYLHSKRVLHRDLKPANVLVDDCLRAKIADFGQTRPWIPGRANTLDVCTPLYSAPELMLRDVFYGAAIDAWSLGCIHYELLHGERLMNEDTVEGNLGHLSELFGAELTPDRLGLGRTLRASGHDAARGANKGLMLREHRAVSENEALVLCGLLRPESSQRMSASSARQRIAHEPLARISRANAKMTKDTPPTKEAHAARSEQGRGSGGGGRGRGEGERGKGVLP